MTYNKQPWGWKRPRGTDANATRDNQPAGLGRRRRKARARGGRGDRGEPCHYLHDDERRRETPAGSSEGQRGRVGGGGGFPATGGGNGRVVGLLLGAAMRRRATAKLGDGGNNGEWRLEVDGGSGARVRVGEQLPVVFGAREPAAEVALVLAEPTKS